MTNNPLKSAGMLLAFIIIQGLLPGGTPSVAWSCIPLQQEVENAAPPKTEWSQEEQILHKSLGSPRDTIQTFLVAMDNQSLEKAMACLDLGWMDSVTAEVKGGIYADKLYMVLTHIWDLQTHRITNKPDHAPPFQLSDCIDNISAPEKWQDAKEIQLTKSASGLWRFSHATLEAVEVRLWPKWQNQIDPDIETPRALSVPVWIANRFPVFLHQNHFLLKDYQWICLLILALLGYLAGRLSRFLLDWITRTWFRVIHARVDDDPRTMLWRPVSLLVNALVWYFGAKWIDLPPGLLHILLVALKFFAVVIAVWTAFRAINVLANYLKKRAELTPSRYDDSLVPLVSNSLKIFAVLIGTVLFVDVFALDWKTVLGGFGVGGVALAIASKDVLGNFFGSITVLTDRPFEIGDSVVIDSKVEGTVESVGMRSSRIRTYHGSEVVVPNSLLTTAIVDNLGRRKMRRFKTILNLEYNTPVNSIDGFCAGIRQILQNSPNTNEQTAHVYLNEFGPSSVDILVYVFINTMEYETELRERHSILRNILRLAEELKVNFAFPTRTLQLQTAENQPLELPDSTAELEALARDIANRISRN